MVSLPNGKILWREVRSTDGYMSVHPKEQHFGLGNAKRVKLKVIWPNGKEQNLGPFKADQRLNFQL